MGYFRCSFVALLQRGFREGPFIEPHIEQAFSPEHLAAACAPWAISAEHVQLVGETESFVFRSERDRLVLRSTHTSHRSTAALEAELDFVRFLRARGLPVCGPVLSRSGHEWHAVGDDWHVCCFEQARGEPVLRSEPRSWNARLFERWGETLARFHEAAQSYAPPAGRPERGAWFEDDLIIGQHFPPEEADLAERLARLVEQLKARARSPSSFGLIHADLHSNNFFAASDGALSVFDFDDACQHWFSFDLAVIALQLPRGVPTAERQAIWDQILAGYRRVLPLPPDFQAEMPLMMKLRALQLQQFMHKKWRPAEGEAARRARLAAAAQAIRDDAPFDVKL